MKCYNCSLPGETAVPLMVLRTALFITAQSTCSSSQPWSIPINIISILSRLGTQQCQEEIHHHFFSVTKACPLSLQEALKLLTHTFISVLQPNEAQASPLVFKHTNLIVLLSFFLLCISDKNLSISCNFKHTTCSDFSQFAQLQLLQYRPPSLSDPSVQSSSESYALSSHCPKGVLLPHSH